MIYKIIKWLEKITYRIFKKEINRDVYEEIEEIKKRITETKIKELEYNEKISNNLSNNKYKKHIKNIIMAKNNNSKNF